MTTSTVGPSIHWHTHPPTHIHIFNETLSLEVALFTRVYSYMYMYSYACRFVRVIYVSSRYREAANLLLLNIQYSTIIFLDS
jgi:hypothetical protein